MVKKKTKEPNVLVLAGIGLLAGGLLLGIELMQGGGIVFLLLALIKRIGN